MSCTNVSAAVRGSATDVNNDTIDDESNACHNLDNGKDEFDLIDGLLLEMTMIYGFGLEAGDEFIPHRIL